MFDFVDFIMNTLLAVLTVVVLFIVCLFLASPFMIWKSATVESSIYNQKYGTNYTASEFFWGKDQINTQTQTIKLKKD